MLFLKLPEIFESNIDIPLVSGAFSAKLIYLYKVPSKETPSGPLSYLHLIRSISRDNWSTKSDKALDYYQNISAFVRAYHKWAEGKTFQVIVRPPSSRYDAEPYAAALLRAMPDIGDYTDKFSKRPGSSAGESTTVQEVIDDWKCGLQCDALSDVRTVVIVDDCYTRGYTSGAVVSFLIKAGLPRDASVVVCAPLWIPQN